MIAHPQHPIVNLTIDVTQNVRKCLDPARFDPFLAGIKAFNQNLRALGIPTIYVAMAKTKAQIFLRLAPWPSPDAGLQDTFVQINNGLMPLCIRADEDIVFKDSNNLFQMRAFVQLLEKYDTKHVIISGTNTTACIKASAMGASDEGYTSWIIYDLLADLRVLGDPNTAQQESTPAWHRATLQATAQQNPDITLLTAATCLSRLKLATPKPAP